VNTPPILRVAVNTPLNRYFDYLYPTSWGGHDVRRGTRVRVPFGRTRAIGIVAELSPTTSWPRSKLRHADEIIDREPILDEELVKLLKWAAEYYHRPPGEVFWAALPGLLRRGGESEASEEYWRAIHRLSPEELDRLRRRAPRQAEILDVLAAMPSGVPAKELVLTQPRWRATMKALSAKGWVEVLERKPQTVSGVGVITEAPPVLTAHQQSAIDTLLKHKGGFACYLLDGVTGSGKTEVYLRAIAQALQADRQALLLVPEIGLTPQLVQRIRARFHSPLAVMHSGLSGTDRLAAWRAARSGEAGIIIGTRSAVFTALKRPGLIVVDEEHDLSFKQQEGFRYSARDLAVFRAKQHGIPIILGSATPSLESIHNADTSRYLRLRLPERPDSSQPPVAGLIDLRRHASRQGLSTPLLTAARRHLDAGGQVLLYLNRRGYAPSLFCTGCGWVAECRRCDARMTVHRAERRLECHHCGANQGIPETCGACGCEVKPVGQGTERIEEILTREFPGFPIARIDRNTMQRRGAMEAAFAQIRSGHARILVGTQMLTKGHHFPQVTLVGVINADQGLFGADFRSSERLAQTIVQVSGRAGRAHLPGEVLIQTAYPEHPLLQELIQHGYDSFAAAALEERRAASWPPFSNLVLLRAEATNKELPLDFLKAAKSAAVASATKGIEILGPASAPMERKAGLYRAQLLLQSPHRSELHKLLTRWRDEIETIKEAKRVRWSLDVDPLELF